MAKVKKAKIQIAVRLDHSAVKALDSEARKRSVGGAEVTRSDLIRIAVESLINGGG